MMWEQSNNSDIEMDFIMTKLPDHTINYNINFLNESILALQGIESNLYHKNNDAIEINKNIFNS